MFFIDTDSAYCHHNNNKVWILMPSPLDNPTPSRSARQTRSVWAEHLTRFQLFAATISANTVIKPNFMMMTSINIIQREIFLFVCLWVKVYLMAPSTTADLQMIFTLGDGSSIYRYWKMRISLLPCSSTNLGTLNIVCYSCLLLLR